MASSAVLDSLLGLCAAAQKQADVVDELSGRSTDGAALVDTLARLSACAKLLANERERTLFLAPSYARLQEEIEHLRGRVQQTQLQLARATHKKGAGRVEFLPGLAYNVHAPGLPPSMVNLVQKLELVDSSQFYAVPQAKVPTLLHLSQETLRGLSAFVPHLQPDVTVAPGTAPLLTALAAGVARHARDLAAACSDRRERDAILSANDAFEAQASAFVANVRKPLASEGERRAQTVECLRAASALAGVITPRSVADLVQQQHPSHTGYYQSSFDSSDH